MIDLHLHTKYSDGSDTLIELLKKAESLELEYISITDHDTCEAYKELETIDVKKYFSGKIIPGIEIKCSYKRRIIEILGYNINLKKMNEYMDKYEKEHSKEKKQQKYFDILYEKCLNKGLIMCPKENINFNPQTDWASIPIYEEIKSHQENKEKLPTDLWTEFSTFSKKYVGNPNSDWYIDKSKDFFSIEEAIKVVKNTGGLVFLPHIFVYKWSDNKKELLDDIVNNYDIDGIECMHSEFNQEEIDYLLKYADENNFYKSGGSDYHGIHKKGIEMKVGKGNLKIEVPLISNWVGTVK